MQGSLRSDGHGRSAQQERAARVECERRGVRSNSYGDSMTVQMPDGNGGVRVHSSVGVGDPTGAARWSGNGAAGRA